MAEKKTETTVEEVKDDKSMFVNWGSDVKESSVDKETQDTLREIEKQQVNDGSNTNTPIIPEPVKSQSNGKETPVQPTPPQPASTEKKTSEPATPEQKSTEQKTPEQKETKSDLVIPDTSVDKPVDKSVDKPAETTVDPKPVVDENVLVVPETTLKKDSWMKLSTDQGFKIQKDDYNSYLKGYEDHISHVSETAKSEIDKDIFNRISPSGRKMLEYELNGGNYFELQKTLNEYDKYLSLNDENLIREDYKSQVDVDGNKFYTNDRVEELLNELSESENKLREKANSIRVSVNNARSETERQTTDMQQQIANANDQEATNDSKAESEAISTVLAGKDEYMGKKITEEVRSYLQGQWDSGQVHESLQDPKVMADFMIFSSFKDQIFKDNNRKEFQKGAESVRKDLSNIPLDLGGGKRVEEVKDSENTFSAWKEVPVTA